MNILIAVVAFIVLAPVVGGLIAGFDRILTAKLQGRYGPPLLQPFYDVFKLLEKQHLSVNRFHCYYVVCYLAFTVFSGCMLFAGNDILMAIFALVLADTFIILAAYSSNSPYSLIGAERELLQGLAAEPILLVTALGFYFADKSFMSIDILCSDKLVISYIPGIFVALICILPIKFRKSPFDIATSHHAHQELVKGLTTEFAGPTLAFFEIAHWYETVFLLGLVFLFFAKVPIIAALVVVAAYIIQILIDNTFARLQFKKVLGIAWTITILLGGGNLLVLYIKNIW